MTATNHALTGALVAITIDKPLLAIPLAFASHFVLDALPHFGYPDAGYGETFGHRLAWFVSAMDITAFVALIFLSWQQVLLVYACAFVAISPDFAWPYRYFFFEKRGLAKPGEGNRFNRWHNRIQWCERPWGIWFEIGWFILILSLVISLS